MVEQGVRSCKKFSGYMDHFQIEVGKVKKSVSFLPVKSLELAKVSEIFMIGENLYGKRRSMKVMSLGFQGVDDGEEFVVIEVIISFCLRK